MNGHISTRTRELKPSSTHPHARKSARTHAHTYTCTQKISSYPRDRNRTPAVAHKQQRYTIRHTQRKHRDGPRKIKAMRMEQTHLSDPVPRIGFKAIRMEQTSIFDPVPRTGWRVFLKRLLDWGHSSRPPPSLLSQQRLHIIHNLILNHPKPSHGCGGRDPPPS